MELGVDIEGNEAWYILRGPERVNEPQHSSGNGPAVKAVASKGNSRYAINVYGCSQAAYKVVSTEAERIALVHILQMDKVLGFYARREEEEMLAIVKDQLPTVETAVLYKHNTPVSGEGGSAEENNHKRKHNSTSERPSRVPK